MVKQACEAPGSYLGWAKKVGVNETWLDAFFLLDAGLDQKLVSFLKQAKSQGMGVQFLVSDMKQFNTLLTFCGTQLLKAGVFPDAFQTDYEPGNKEDATSQFQDHVTMKSRLADFEEEFGTKIRLTVSVQYWYIDYGPADTVGNKIPTTDYPVSKATVAADGKSTVPCPPKPYGDALLELGLDLTLQDYGNPNWDATPLSLAKLWCDRALDHKCQVYVGLDVGPPTSAYAFEQDIAGMEALLESIYTSLFSHSGFAGMAVHNTLWYGAFT